LELTNRELLTALDAADPSWPIFLMTDDAQCLARMKAAYGQRIIATDCQRTDTDEGVHYLPTVDPVRAGREIMIDTYLALRADRFIGNSLSNVSAMIAVMKDWAPDSLSLVGRFILRERNLHIYQIPTLAKGGS
jgi:protein O-GlcNAc transferase